MRRTRFRLATAALATRLVLGVVTVDAQKPDVPPPAASHTVQAGVQRWFDVQTLTLQARYRRVETSAGVVAANHMQDSLTVRARIKFDKAGRYTLNFNEATGPSFTAAWNNVGWGRGGPRVTGMFLKQIFVGATPVKGLELSYGSLGFVRGESTEITTFDNDGYMAGARVSAKRPKDLYFDEVAFTEGYVGDATTPGFTDRSSRLADFNYWHLLAAKKAGKTLGWSADYTGWSGAGTLRGAVNVKTPRAQVVDFVRYEQYWRVNHDPYYGFAAYAEKAITKRVTAGGGYADIDENYGGLNADRFNKGRRLFALASVKVFQDLTASTFLARAVHNSFAVPNKRRIDFVVAYNALGPLQRAGLFR